LLRIPFDPSAAVEPRAESILSVCISLFGGTTKPQECAKQCAPAASRTMRCSGADRRI